MANFVSRCTFSPAQTLFGMWNGEETWSKLIKPSNSWKKWCEDGVLWKNYQVFSFSIGIPLQIEIASPILRNKRLKISLVLIQVVIAYVVARHCMLESQRSGKRSPSVNWWRILRTTSIECGQQLLWARREVVQVLMFWFCMWIGTLRYLFFL